MRKLVVCNIVSLDGFYSGPGGDVMAMPFDDGFSDYNAERLRAADTRDRRGHESAGCGARNFASQRRHREGRGFEQSEARRGRGVGPDPRSAARGRAR